MDSNGNGTIEFTEYLIHASRLLDLSIEEQTRLAFQVYDIDGDGFISPAELRNVMPSFEVGQPLTDEKVAEIFSKADIDKDGNINYEEFVELLMPSTFVSPTYHPTAAPISSARSSRSTRGAKGAKHAKSKSTKKA